MERLNQFLTGILIAFVVIYGILLLGILDKQIDMAKSITSINETLKQRELTE